MKKLFVILFSLVLIAGCKNTPSSDSSLEVSTSSATVESSSSIENSSKNSPITSNNEVSSSDSNELETSDVLGGNYGDLH